MLRLVAHGEENGTHGFIRIASEMKSKVVREDWCQMVGFCEGQSQAANVTLMRLV